MRTRHAFPRALPGLTLALAAAPLYAQTPPAEPATAPSATDPSYSELVAEVRALRAEVERMRAAQRNYVSPAEVDDTVKRMMEDAERNSRFLKMDGATAGWNGKRFFLRSDDGKFSISPVMTVQARHIANYRVETPPDESDPAFDDGFEFRRIRLGVQGNYFSEKFTYRLVFAIDQGRNAVTRDAWMMYEFTDDFSVQFGQFKDPWTHEEDMSDSRQMAVERSLVNSLIGGANTARVEGVNLIFWQGKPWRAQASVHDGAQSSDTPFFNQPAEEQSPLLGGSEATFGASGRLEHFVFGDPGLYDDYSARGNKEDLLVLGTGVHLTQAGDNDAVFHAADVQWENTKGTGAYAQYIGLYRTIQTPSEGDRGVAVGDFYDYGLLFQLSQMVAPKIELFTRYGFMRLDEDSFTEDREVTETDIHEITAGVNYYIHGHNVKLTLDLTYLPNGSPEATRLGYLATEENGFVLRTQFQLSL